MIYLLADPHFYHQNLVEWGIRKSGYEEQLWAGLKSMSPNSMLVCLGDVTLSDDVYIHSRLNEECPAQQRVLIIGNHDSRSIWWYLRHGWSHATYGMLLERFGLKILFTHRPVDLPDWIDWNIHGHYHRYHKPSDQDDGKHIVVSCETQGYQPLSLKSLLGY